MILAVDADYRGADAFVAGVTFQNWEDERESGIFTSTVQGVGNYVPGQFYRRELPGILKLIEEHCLTPETIVIDGFVFLDGIAEPGLGYHLYLALKEEVKVVGVAKRRYRGIAAECELFRGRSAKPLYITSVGISLGQAKDNIASMHGRYRIPMLLKKADFACRRGESSPQSTRRDAEEKQSQNLKA